MDLIKAKKQLNLHFYKKIEIKKVYDLCLK